MASKSPELIEINGSYLEGGGQILRISTALSSLLKKPIKISRIRAGRKDGGLKAQHLTGIELLSRISQANLTGASLKSTEVMFIPEIIKPGRYVADTKTAGSICLIVQNALPCLIFTKEVSELDLRGGTNAENAPQIDYFQMVFRPVAKQFGIECDLNILRRGYYPKGGGEVYLKTHPLTKPLASVNLTEFGSLKRIYGRSFVAGFLPLKVADAMANRAKEILSVYSNVPIEIEIVKEPEHTYVGTGTGIIIIAETTTGHLLAGSALGKKGVSAEKVAQNATESLMADIDCESCVDEYMQDQLIIFMSLAKGKSRVKCGPLSLHTKTAIHFSQSITGAQFNVIEINSKSNIIECDGIGFEPTN